MKPEQRTQVALCSYIERKLPDVTPFVIKIDNEGIRSIAGHVLAKRMGLNKGASDLFIAWPTETYHGLFIEVKPEGYKLPNTIKVGSHIYNQIRFQTRMHEKKYCARIICGIDEGIDTIDEYFERY